MSRVQMTLTSVEQMLNSGKAEEARQLLLRALQKEPNHPALCNATAVAFVMLRQHEQALFYAQKAAKLLPDEGEVLSTLGSILSMMGRHDEAAPILRRALDRAPHSPNARLALCNTLNAGNRHSEVVEHARLGLQHNPADFELAVKLVLGLLNCGQSEEAVALARQALSFRPNDQSLASWHAFAINYLPDPTPSDILRAHQHYGNVLDADPAIQSARARFTGNAARSHIHPIGPRERLKVGLVSPDFRTHSVAFFVEPILRHLDRARFEIVCYSTAKREDATTARLKSYPVQWRAASSLTERDLAERIFADRIDLLVDLAGHTSDNSLPVFAMKPAPVQATYCGYPATTGLGAIDVRLVDSHTDPADHDTTAPPDSHGVESIVRLDPCFLCFNPPAESPEPTPPPSTQPGATGVTFGSFNTLLKLNRRVVEVWTRLLQAVPNSRLLLKATQLADPKVREDTISRFAAAGLDPARVEVIEATASQADHLAMYSRLDVALDPFPYAGTTTTCEALWMGVPVVTLAGRIHAGRVGVSLLNAVGLPDLIAASEDEYLRLASDLARDRERLTAHRRTLRSQVASSPLCDGPAFARRFAQAIEEIWQQRGGTLA